MTITPIELAPIPAVNSPVVEATARTRCGCDDGYRAEVT
jgi:hypothetical protein